MGVGDETRVLLFKKINLRGMRLFVFVCDASILDTD